MGGESYKWINWGGWTHHKEEGIRTKRSSSTVRYFIPTAEITRSSCYNITFLYRYDASVTCVKYVDLLNPFLVSFHFSVRWVPIFWYQRYRTLSCRQQIKTKPHISVVHISSPTDIRYHHHHHHNYDTTLHIIYFTSYAITYKLYQRAICESFITVIMYMHCGLLGYDTYQNTVRVEKWSN